MDYVILKDEETSSNTNSRDGVVKGQTPFNAWSGCQQPTVRLIDIVAANFRPSPGIVGRFDAAIDFGR